MDRPWDVFAKLAQGLDPKERHRSGNRNGAKLNFCFSVYYYYFIFERAIAEPTAWDSYEVINHGKLETICQIP